MPPAHAPRPVVGDVWAPPKASPMAIGALVLSLLWIGGIGSIGAVVLGHIAKREIVRSQGRLSGTGLATAGLVIGYIGLAIMALYLLIDIAVLTHG